MKDRRTEGQPLQMSLFARATRNASWVASHLGTSTQTVCRLIEDGTLEAYKLRNGGQWHICLDSVGKYEAEIKRRYGIESRVEDGAKGAK